MVVHIFDRDRAVADAVASLAEAEGLRAVVYDDFAALHSSGSLSDDDLLVICDYVPNLSDEAFAVAILEMPRPAHVVFLSNSRAFLPECVRRAAGENQLLLRKPLDATELLRLIRVNYALPTI